MILIPRLRCALDATLVCSLMLTTSLAASGETANEGAARALAATSGIALCAHDDRTTPLRYVRLLHTEHAILANGTSIVAFEGGCEDGNDNDAIYILAAHGSQPYKLVSKPYGFLEHLTPDGTLVLMSNPGGVNVRYHETQHWNGTTFGPASSVMTWVPTGESKPTPVPLAFAVGTSSATVSGMVRQDFPDVYQFDARAGQTMSVDVRPLSGSIGQLSIGIKDGADITSGKALTWRGTLPKAMHTVMVDDITADTKPGGHYTITVDGADDKRAAYTMKVSIR